jgi:hypothetical protein
MFKRPQLVPLFASITLLTGCAQISNHTHPPLQTPQANVVRQLPRDFQNAKTAWIPPVGGNYYRITGNYSFYVDSSKVRTPSGSDIIAFLPMNSGYLVLAHVALDSQLMRRIERGNYSGRTLTTGLTPINGYSFTWAYYYVTNKGKDAKLLAVSRSINGILVSHNAIYCSNNRNIGQFNEDKLVGIDTDNKEVHGPNGFVKLLPLPKGKWFGMRAIHAGLANRFSWEVITGHKQGWSRIKKIGFFVDYNGDTFDLTSYKRPIYIDMPSYSTSYLNSTLRYQKSSLLLNGQSDASSGTILATDLPGLPRAYHPKSEPDNFSGGMLPVTATSIASVNALGSHYFLYSDNTNALVSLVTLGLGSHFAIIAKNTANDQKVKLFNTSTFSSQISYIPIQTPSDAYLLMLKESGGAAGSATSNGRAYDIGHNKWVSSTVMLPWANKFGIGTIY